MVKLFGAIFPKAKRTGYHQVHQGPTAAADVGGTPFWIECKHHVRPYPEKALAQAAESCPKGQMPIAVCKTDRRPPTVTMYLADFLDLVREWKERAE